MPIEHLDELDLGEGGEALLLDVGELLVTWSIAENDEVGLIHFGSWDDLAACAEEDVLVIVRRDIS